MSLLKQHSSPLAAEKTSNVHEFDHHHYWVNYQVTRDYDYLPCIMLAVMISWNKCEMADASRENRRSSAGRNRRPHVEGILIGLITSNIEEYCVAITLRCEAPVQPVTTTDIWIPRGSAKFDMSRHRFPRRFDCFTASLTWKIGQSVNVSPLIPVRMS